KTKLFEWREQKVVEKRFYENASFRVQDEALLAAYQNISPYQISKEYLIKNGAKNPYAYGETPLTTMAKIAKECDLGTKDTIIEMGAGRGRTSLFLAEYVGARVLAYEQISSFVEKMVPSKNLKIFAEDMFSADFAKATAIYLYGTMLEDSAIRMLTKKFPHKAKIITVSYPLNAYSENYSIKKTFSGRFPWGKTKVYWNERIV
ncbi:MAG: hypothetical protein K940chlam6_01081, partial [Chlamydiae bacterium]|nr:hypothetical protein [Chlamydiota bacterium]